MSLRFITFPLLIALGLFPDMSSAQSHRPSDSGTRGRPPISSRIIGGQPASTGQFPFMAAIVSSISPNNFLNGFFCGGTLINRRWVLTAAHCVTTPNGSTFTTNSPSSQYVVLKLRSLVSDPGEKRNINRIVVHPNYNPDTSDSDLALLELTQDSTATPIWITSFDVQDPTTSTAIGWGVTSTAPGASASPDLNFVNMPIVSNAICDVPYTSGTITKNMICAGLAMGGVDTCQGDSGGPLVVSQNGQYAVAGVTSWGTGCAQAGFYGAYTRIAKFGSFITSYVPSPYSLPNSAVSGPFALWNGFLGMSNILEFVNPSGSTQSLSVYLTDQNGSVVSINQYSVPAGAQQDVIIDSLTGFEADRYGIVRIAGNISGRTSYYRALSAAFQSFDYAFAIAFANPLFGPSTVGFNTFQPSLNSADINNLVANWLSVVNLSASTSGFTIKKYNQIGSLLSSNHISLSAFGRMDVDGGHVVPGPSHVGLLEIVPDSLATPYLSQLVRYGYNEIGGFDFAFPLIPRAGLLGSSPLSVPVTTTLNAQSWLEVLNSSASPGGANVLFYNQNGTLASSTTLNSIPAKGQIHLNINMALGNSALGHAEIIPLAPAAIVSQAMTYARNAGSGSIDAMYGSQVSRAGTSDIAGSYNLFLGMQNWLKVINPTSSTLTFDLTISSLFSSGSSQTLQLGPFSSVDLFLNDPNFGTAVDSYGTVLIHPQAGGKVQAQVLRIKYDSATGDPEYLMPTEVQ